MEPVALNRTLLPNPISGDIAFLTIQHSLNSLLVQKTTAKVHLYGHHITTVAMETEPGFFAVNVYQNIVKLFFLLDVEKEVSALTSGCGP